MGNPVLRVIENPANWVNSPVRELFANDDFMTVLTTYIKKECGQDVSNKAAVRRFALKFRDRHLAKSQKAVEGVVARTVLTYGRQQGISLLKQANLEWFENNYPASLVVYRDDEFISCVAT